jgi:hypothetical protein
VEPAPAGPVFAGGAPPAPPAEVQAGRSPNRKRGGNSFGGSPASVSTAAGSGSPASLLASPSPAKGGGSLARERNAQKSRDNAVMLQLTKTKMCAFFERGKCASNNCRYAHSADELRSPPNLQKTKLCRAFMQGSCQDESCSFAHGDGDLRVTAGIYKTQMCNFFERGYCKKGDRCNHAHGSVDIRPPATATPGGGERPPRSALPLAELLADAETSRPSQPTPTKSVTELASLAFSPMPQSPLWAQYGMPGPLPLSPLGAAGDPRMALWSRDPIDMLVDKRVNKENEMPYGLAMDPTPFRLNSSLYAASAQVPLQGSPWCSQQVAIDLNERLASLDSVVRELSADVADLCGAGEGKRLLHKI